MSKFNEALLSLARNLGVLFVFVVPFSQLLFIMGYNIELIIAFSTANLLIWSDGFLTVCALDKGATELNPLMNLMSKITSRKMFLVISRCVGSLFSVYGIVEKNTAFLLVVSWLFSMVVFMNSLSLRTASRSIPKSNRKYTSQTDDYQPHFIGKNVANQITNESEKTNYHNSDSHNKNDVTNCHFISPTPQNHRRFWFGSLSSLSFFKYKKREKGGL